MPNQLKNRDSESIMQKRRLVVTQEDTEIDTEIDSFSTQRTVTAPIDALTDVAQQQCGRVGSEETSSGDLLTTKQSLDRENLNASYNNSDKDQTRLDVIAAIRLRHKKLKEEKLNKTSDTKSGETSKQAQSAVVHLEPLDFTFSPKINETLDQHKSRRSDEQQHSNSPSALDSFVEGSSTSSSRAVSENAIRRCDTTANHRLNRCFKCNTLTTENLVACIGCKRLIHRGCNVGTATGALTTVISAASFMCFECVFASIGNTYECH